MNQIIIINNENEALQAEAQISKLKGEIKTLLESASDKYSTINAIEIALHEFSQNER